MSRTWTSLAAIALAPALAFGQDTGPAGGWTGSIEAAEGDPVELELTLAQAVDGSWSGHLTAPSLRDEPAPLAAITVLEHGVRFTAPDLPGAPEFVASLSADGRELAGTVFRQPPPPPPATDIHLMQLAVDGSSWQLGEPVNVTDRDGYDNQPRFVADGSALLYTSIRDGQADIYRYELEGGRTFQVTATGESEYSPTPLPSGDGFSVVRVEDDGTQRLWSFDADGGAPMLVLGEIRPVGYHGWLDAHRLGLFVLGTPPTLHLADAELGTSRVVAENIGRSIHVTPDGEGVSFVHKASETDWRIERLELASGARRTLVSTRPASEDFIWTPDGRILMAEGSKLFACSPDDPTPTWIELADLGGHAIHGITRLAMSADARWLAVVGERGGPAPAAERIPSPFVLRRSR